ncbi:MAG: prepilin-type N-terminal cleavage/methylation domain-containing protein [bacterium]
MITIKANVKPEPCQQGFTLIEVMISLGIFAIGILGLAVMQTRAITANGSTMRRVNAAQLASDEIEAIMLADYDSVNDIPSDNPSDRYYKDNFPKGKQVQAETGNVAEDYFVTQDVVDDNTKKIITLTVSWDEGRTPHSFIINYEKSKNS